MGIKEWEEHQRSIGNDEAANIAVRLRDEFGDVPQAQEESSPVVVDRFSDEAREELEKRGFRIYNLTGKSINAFREEGRKFWPRRINHPEFQEVPSRVSEIAANPGRPFLRNSNSRSLEAQQLLIDNFSNQLTTGKSAIKGVQAIMGDVPDYVELSFAHLDATGEHLFGTAKIWEPAFGFKEMIRDSRYARTRTSYWCVGGLTPNGELDIDALAEEVGYAYVFAAPLVVPA